MRVAPKHAPRSVGAASKAIDLGKLTPKSFHIGASDGHGSAYPTILDASVGNVPVTVTLPDKDKLRSLPCRIQLGGGTERVMTAPERKAVATALAAYIKNNPNDSARPFEQKNKAYAQIVQELRAAR